MRAISTIIWIILLLVSAILGGLLSYMWVIASFYNMPTDRRILVVENVDFSVTNFTRFNVTVLNPSNSAEDINITGFRLNVEGKNQTYDITNVESHNFTSGYVLNRGTRQTFRCLRNWSNFTNENIRIEPIAESISTITTTYTLPKVVLNVVPVFNSSATVESFSLILNSGDSAADLTISEIKLFGESLNVTPPLEYALQRDKTVNFNCSKNWDSLRNQEAVFMIKTKEGFEAGATTDKLSGASLYIQNVGFDYNDTSHIFVNVTSIEESTTPAMLNGINMTLPDNSTIALNTTQPLGFLPISPNSSRTITCIWDWSSASLRNQTITVTVYTEQGFQPPNKTVTTPAEIVWNITDAEFDLDDMDHFSVNATNLPCSLRTINVTRIQINDQNTTLTPPSVALDSGTHVLLNCTYNWTSLRGQNVTITVMTVDGLNATFTTTIPLVQLKIPNRPDLVLESLGPYVNITIANLANSLGNVTVNKIVFGTWFNGTIPTYEVDGTLTVPELGLSCNISIGQSITIVCHWNWVLYIKGVVVVTVYTAEGYQVTETFMPP
jgi:hypothetical protein